MGSRFGSLVEYGHALDERQPSGSFTEVDMMPDSQKEQLCRDLLAEFGVTNVAANAKGELIHSCCLPFGLHSNGDRNPSASLNFKRLTYNCYGCGGGGLLWFIGVCRGTSGTEAKKWLRNETGQGSDELPLSALLEFFDAVATKRAEDARPIPHYDFRVIEPWQVIHPYMTEMRKVPEETLRRLKVGYGVIPTRVGDTTVESHRIVIPHVWRDRLAGWQSRRLIDDGTPRYKSTPDFPKDTTLYNADRPGGTVVVVESPMSVLRHEATHPIVATFGASVTEKQIRLLSRYDRVVTWFDNDNAGWKATEEVGEALTAYCPVSSVVSPYAADPADFDADGFDTMLDTAVPFSLWRRPDELIPLEVA